MSKSTGLRTEILITLSLLMGAALLLGGVLMLRLSEQSLLEQKVAQLRLLTGTIVRSLADANAPERPIPLTAGLLRQLPDDQLHDGWWLYGPDLSLLASFSKEEGEPSSTARMQQVRLSGQGLEIVEFPPLLLLFSDAPRMAHFIEPIYQRGQFRGLLDIRYSLNDIRQRLLLSLRLTVLYVLFYGMVLISVGYYLLQRNVVRPARNLLRATVEVGRGNLENRLPVAGPSEIAQLAAAYNHMVEALQGSRQETRDHIETLQRTRDELVRSEKLASVGQLAAGLAHELGNPLAALIGYLELLKQQLVGAAEEDIVERSLVETSRIDFLVRELLDFSRPDQNDLAVSVNPAAELKSCVRLLHNQGMLTDIDIRDELPASLASIRINKNRLQQVFVNLLMNAIHACNDGGQITLTAGSECEAVWIGIADNGPGIADEDLGRIFEPFYTTKEPGQGTGLGLAICQRIITEAQGNIEVDSVTGKGSVFKLVFKQKAT